MRIVIQHTPEIAYYTRLSDWLPSFPVRLEDCSFAVSCIESNVRADLFSAWKVDIPGLDYIVPGKELLSIARGMDPQFLWGVFSAFPNLLEPANLTVTDDFFLDGNPSIWEREEGNWFIAEAWVEVISYDSSCMIVCTAHQGILSYFKKRFRVWEAI